MMQAFEIHKYLNARGRFSVGRLLHSLALTQWPALQHSPTNNSTCISKGVAKCCVWTKVGIRSYTKVNSISLLLDYILKLY